MKKVKAIIFLLSVMILIFLILGIFWNIDITGRTTHDKSGGGSGFGGTNGDSGGGGGGGGGSSSAVYEIKPGETSQVSDFKVDVSGTSGIKVSEAQYSSFSGASTGISGTIYFEIEKPVEKLDFFLPNAKEITVRKRSGENVDPSISYAKPTAFIGISATPEAHIEIRDPSLGDYKISYKSSEISVRESTITSMDGTFYGKTLTIKNYGNKDYSEVSFFTVVKDTGLVTVIVNGKIIEQPNISPFGEGEVSVNFDTDLQGETKVDILVVDTKGEETITKQSFSKEAIPLLSEIPVDCRDNEYAETIGDCKVAGGDTTKIITNSENIFLTRENLITFELERGCPQIARVVEVCPSKEISISEPEISLSPTDGVERSISFGDDDIEATIKVNQNKINIEFGSARALEFQPSPASNTGKEIDQRIFAYGLWALFALFLPIIFLSFRDKNLSAIKSLISSTKTALRKGDRKSAIEYYHLASKIYSKLPLEKKKKLKKEYFEYSKMMRR